MLNMIDQNKGNWSQQQVIKVYTWAMDVPFWQTTEAAAGINEGKS